MNATVTLRTRLPPSLCRDIVARLRDLARVVKLVDTGDLKSPAHCERAGSSPAPGTKTLNKNNTQQFLLLITRTPSIDDFQTYVRRLNNDMRIDEYLT